MFDNSFDHPFVGTQDRPPSPLPFDRLRTCLARKREDISFVPNSGQTPGPDAETRVSGRDGALSAWRSFLNGLWLAAKAKISSRVRPKDQACEGLSFAEACKGL